MDDFEAFRKKRQAEKKAEKEAEAEAKKADEAAKKMGWVDGLGPQGPKNPKVKGFVLGRFWQPKKIDPDKLEKPKGFERTRLTDEPPAAERPPTPPEELKKIPKIKGKRRY